MLLCLQQSVSQSNNYDLGASTPDYDLGAPSTIELLAAPKAEPPVTERGDHGKARKARGKGKGKGGDSAELLHQEETSFGIGI